jgi:hypothetical protein
MQLSILTFLAAAALTLTGCGGEPLPVDDCTPGICPDGRSECGPDERLPSYCPGQPPELTPAPDGGSK